MADIEKFIYYENGSKKVLKPTDRIVVGSGGLAFEGATSDDFETSLAVTDPTADRTITFPDEDGDVALLQSDTLPKALSFPVKNPSTTTALTKGQVVYISGHSGNKPEVSLAKADSSSTMPAFGLVTADIAAEGEGYVTSVGLLKGLDTSSGYTLGDIVYVSDSVAGGLTTSSPSGSSLIQNIGKVTRIDASVGSILVGGAGRTAATPNLNEGKFFIGNASNQSTQSSYQLPSTLTNNAILVANSDGSSVLSTDLLTIDTTNDRVGIGTSSPARTLHLVGDVQYEGSMRIDQYHTSADGPDVLLQKARGTTASPTAVAANDELGKFVMYGHNGTSFLESAIIRSSATVDGSTYGGTLEFDTGTGGTTSNRLKIDESGVITFNGAYSFPTSDGSASQVLTTDGSGNITFSTPQAATDRFVQNTVGSSGQLTSISDNRRQHYVLTQPNISVSVPNGGSSNVTGGIMTFTNKSTGNVTFSTPAAYWTDGTQSGSKTLKPNETRVMIWTSQYTTLEITNNLYESFTTNRIIHSDASGALTASDFLKVDDTNNRLGIGTLTPLTTVEIVGDTAGEAQLSIRQHNDNADGPDLIFYRSRGTESSKTAVQASDVLTRVNSEAYNGSAYVSAGYYGWNAADGAGNSTFKLATRASGTLADRFTVDQYGDSEIVGSLNITTSLTIGDGAYGFPTTDGTSGQVLTTNGSGTLSFQTVSGGSYTYEAVDSSTTTAFTVEAAYHYSVDCTSAAVTANLPDDFVAGLSAGDSVRFKLKNNTNNLTISANGSDTIDGSSSKVMSNSYESITLVWDGNSEWEIV